jgi:hypothetical protein
MLIYLILTEVIVAEYTCDSAAAFGGKKVDKILNIFPVMYVL